MISRMNNELTILHIQLIFEIHEYMRASWLNNTVTMIRC